MLGDYVYALADPGPPERIFYIGRGKGERVLQHGWHALSSEPGSAPAQHIAALRASDRDPHVYILRHGLSEKEAAEAEAALIDALTLAGVALVNRVSGTDTARGMRTLPSLIADLTAEPLDVGDERALLVVINNTWHEGMHRDALWDAARREWSCRKALPFPFLLLAAAGTIIRGAWRITEGTRRTVTWAELDQQRRRGRPSDAPGAFPAWCFDGHWAEGADRYVGRHVRNASVRANAIGFRYLPDDARFFAPTPAPSAPPPAQPSPPSSPSDSADPALPAPARSLPPPPAG